MNEKNLKEKLRSYVNKTGVKYTYIANKINVHKSTLSHFVNGDRRVSQQTINKIKKYLLENNVL